MRLLIAAGDIASAQSALPPGISRLVEAATDIHVITATYVSRLKWLTGDADAAQHASDERLAAVLGNLASTDADVTGTAGDPLPMTAFGGAIREFRPDHILIGYPQRNRSTWPAPRRQADRTVRASHHHLRGALTGGSDRRAGTSILTSAHGRVARLRRGVWI
jgi:hypothetical protein